MTLANLRQFTIPSAKMFSISTVYRHISFKVLHYYLVWLTWHGYPCPTATLCRTQTRRSCSHINLCIFILKARQYFGFRWIRYAQLVIPPSRNCNSLSQLPVVQGFSDMHWRIKATQRPYRRVCDVGIHPRTWNRRSWRRVFLYFQRQKKFYNFGPSSFPPWARARLVHAGLE